MSCKLGEICKLCEQFQTPGQTDQIIEDHFESVIGVNQRQFRIILILTKLQEDKNHGNQLVNYFTILFLTILQLFIFIETNFCQKCIFIENNALLLPYFTSTPSKKKFQRHCSEIMHKLFLNYMPRCANPRKSAQFENFAFLCHQN